MKQEKTQAHLVRATMSLMIAFIIGENLPIIRAARLGLRSFASATGMVPARSLGTERLVEIGQFDLLARRGVDGEDLDDGVKVGAGGRVLGNKMLLEVVAERVDAR